MVEIEIGSNRREIRRFLKHWGISTIREEEMGLLRASLTIAATYQPMRLQNLAKAAVIGQMSTQFKYTKRYKQRDCSLEANLQAGGEP